MNVNNYLFWVILTSLAIIDWETYRIPNYIIFSGIVFGCVFVGNYWSCLGLFVIGAIFAGYNPQNRRFEFSADFNYKPHFIYGGDVKLFALLGAFQGWVATPIVAMGFVFVRIYRQIFKNFDALALTPFIWLSSLIFAILI